MRALLRLQATILLRLLTFPTAALAIGALTLLFMAGIGHPGTLFASLMVGFVPMAGFAMG